MYSGFSAFLKGSWAVSAIVVVLWTWFFVDVPLECESDAPFIVMALGFFWMFGSISIGAGFIEDVWKWRKNRTVKKIMY